jgi:hypothetical protein
MNGISSTPNCRQIGVPVAAAVQPREISLHHRALRAIAVSKIVEIHRRKMNIDAPATC